MPVQKYYFYECAFCDYDSSTTLAAFKKHVERVHFPENCKTPINVTKGPRPAVNHQSAAATGPALEPEVIDIDDLDSNHADAAPKVVKRRRRSTNPHPEEPISWDSVDTTSGPTFPCPDCDMTFRIEKKMLKHRDLVHLKKSQSVIHQCKFCPYATDVIAAFKKHMSTHRHCQDCDYVSKNLRDMKAHSKDVHKKEVEDSTPALDKEPKTSQVQQEAEEPAMDQQDSTPSQPTGNRPVRTCNSCTFQCKSSYEMAHHYKTHHQGFAQGWTQDHQQDDRSIQSQPQPPLPSLDSFQGGYNPVAYPVQGSGYQMSESYNYQGSPNLNCNQCNFQTYNNEELNLHYSQAHCVYNSSLN